jgi:hypothetical protein
MSRFRWALAGVALILLAGCTSKPPVVQVPATGLEGFWTVTSVQRTGEDDLLQVGSTLTFTADQVSFFPKAGPVLAQAALG